MVTANPVIRLVESGRRKIVKGLIALGGIGFAGGTLSLVKAFIPDIKTAEDIAYEGVEIVHQQGDRAGSAIRIDDLGDGQLGGALGGIGGTNGEPVWVAQVDPAGMSPESEDFFSATADQGVVSYSAVCVHLGCVYGVEPENGCEEFGFCDCHNSAYDFCDMGKVTAGPAPRPIPALEVSVSPDGRVLADGQFNDSIGPDKRAPQEA